MSVTQVSKVTTEITYTELQTLVEKFLKEAGRGSQIGNHKTALKGFREVHQCAENSLVGSELDGDFDAGLKKYVEAQKAAGIKRSTYGPRETLLRNIQELYRTTVVPETPPKSFHAVLRKLIKDRGCSIRSFHREFVKDLISRRTFSKWISGCMHPAPTSILKIIELEKLVGIEPGTLVNLLPKDCSRKRRPAGVTPFGQNLQAAFLKLYCVWTDKLEAEWQGIVTYKSTAVPTERRRKDAVWTSSEGAHLPSAELTRAIFESFVGYCHLPSESKDPCLRGLGIKLDDLSLALIADKNACEGFIEFRRVRSGMRLQPSSPPSYEPKIELTEGKYNDGILQILSTFYSLLLLSTRRFLKSPWANISHHEPSASRTRCLSNFMMRNCRMRNGLAESIAMRRIL